MSVASDVYLGISLTERAIRIATSLGQRSSITSERLRSPEDWVELATYGVPLPEKHRLLACAAVPSGTPPELQGEIVQAARGAGWDGLLLVNALRAASRALRERREERDDAAVVAVDSAITSVGIVGGRSGEVLEDDPVHAIPGREAREVAVSLRCLLKQRSRAQARSLLRKVTVVGESSEVERVGRRSFERELEGLGALEVEFELDPFLLAQGALLLAKDAESQVWRRIRRQWR